MSTILAMTALNVPLSQWKKFEVEVANGRRATTAFHGGKNSDKTALAIFSQLSHENAVLLVHRDFESLPADLRLKISTLCNSDVGSNNVRKGVQRLDHLMGGKLLRDKNVVAQHRVMTKDGWASRDVNPAVAGATRKYGIVR